MDQRADRDIRERQAIAGADFGLRSGDDRIADLQPERSNDVALFAIGIEQQGQAGSAVRIVFDRSHLGGNVMLVALEIDHADISAVAAAAMADGDAAVGIAAAMSARMNDQAALRRGLGDLFECIPGHPTLTGSCGFIFLDCHYFTPSKISRVLPSARVTIAFLYPELGPASGDCDGGCVWQPHS